MIVCTQCGHPNRDDARFCDACGAVLDGVPATREVRKTVTVLFADVTGSTILGETVDPERLRRVFERYFEASRTAVERHGGTVEKFIGDAVMAVFGIPQLHEDDALRAVRAAADLQAALAKLNAELQNEQGLVLAVRVGVNTGSVVAGDASQGQRFATGDAVNVAQRLEAAAEPETILLGAETYDAVRDSVVAEAVEPLALKGKAEPVRAWRLVEVLPEVPAFQRPVTTSFVGRRDELALLREAFERACAEHSCRLCTVIGVPGIGKSRLIRELINAVGDTARVVVGRCRPYGDAITYWPLVEIVRQLSGREDERKALARLLADDDEREVVVDRVLAALGIGGTPGPPEETFWAFRRLLEAASRTHPLIAVVDDVHWAEPTLLDLLEYIAAFSTDAPILVLCAARPELFETRSEWAASRDNSVLVRLSALSESESKTLVEGLAATRVGADTSRLAEIAEGNPLFLEQLLAFQAQDNGGGGELVPMTIQGLLAARIDRLEPDERAVLGAASVEGRLFHRGAVADLLPAGARAQLAANLLALVRKEFVRPDRAEFRGDDGFRFAHILIRDTAYASLPKQLRADLHERFTGWLEGKVGERAGEEYEEILGYHLEQSFRYHRELGRAEEAAALGARAAGRLASAGERALGRGDMPAAASLLERAVRALPPDDPARPDLVRSLGTARLGAGDLEGADRAFAEALESAESADDDRAGTRARVDHARLLMSTGGLTPEAMDAVADDAIAVLEPFGDDVGLADAWLVAAVSGNTQLHLARMEDAAERALAHAQQSGAVREEADALFWIGAALVLGPRPAPEGIARLERMLAEAPGPLVEAHALVSLGTLRAMTGEIEVGRRLYARAIELYRGLGMRLWAAAAGNMTVLAELAAGDATAAEALARRSYDELDEIGERGYLSTGVALLARALSLQARHEEAERFVAMSEELSVPDDRMNEILCSSVRARILAARGEHDEALRRAREAVSIAETTDATETHANALTDLAAVLRAAGRADDEVEALRGALALYEAKGDVASAARARAALAEVAAG